MLAYQTMTAPDGYQVCLFPFEYMYMSQDEGGDYSHAGTYNIDFLGWDANGRVYQCPFYAPCDLRCVDIWDSNSNTRVYQSLERVHLADGSFDFLTIMFSHDDNPSYSVGDIIRQGELLGHTGTTGYVSGDHTHTCCGKGTYQGFTERQAGNWDLTNRCHYWDACYVNDTVIVEGYNHNWVSYTSPSPSYTNLKNRFKFVLYARNLRKKRIIKKNKYY